MIAPEAGLSISRQCTLRGIARSSFYYRPRPVSAEELELLKRHLERADVHDLARYLEIIVEPTFDDFSRNRASVRHAFLACVAIYHAIDRVSSPNKRGGISTGNLREEWRTQSLEFTLVDIIAHHFKHVQSNDRKSV